MKPAEYFKKHFNKDHLLDLYKNNIKYNSAVGLDGINIGRFEKNVEQEIDLIIHKVNNFTYKFTNYKIKLINNGPEKKPRMVEIPTIRDKLLLKFINDLLLDVYKAEIKHCSLHHQIKSTIYNINNSNTFDSFIKLDLKDYYGSVDHDLLLKTISKRIRKKEIIYLIIGAIKNSNNYLKQKKISIREKGVPQGISISNILANIFLFDLDNDYSNNNQIFYARYVDDVLLFTQNHLLEKNKQDCITKFTQLKLSVHTENNDKCFDGFLTEKFSFLGYYFNHRIITVRQKSIDSLVSSLLSLFTSYMYSSHINKTKILEWKLALRITGCIVENKKYGWLFFFSQINDNELLHRLDHILEKQLKRFNLQNKLKLKKFSRTWHEINKNLNSTTYIINYDKYSFSEKKQLLDDLSIHYTSDSEVEYLFKKTIHINIRELEQDLSEFS